TCVDPPCAVSSKPCPRFRDGISFGPSLRSAWPYGGVATTDRPGPPNVTPVAALAYAAHSESGARSSAVQCDGPSDVHTRWNLDRCPAPSEGGSSGGRGRFDRPSTLAFLRWWTPFDP